LLPLAALVAHVFLPLSLFIQLWFGKLDTGTWLGTILFLAGYLVFLYVAGSWSWFGFAYRLVPRVLLLGTAIVTWPGRRHAAAGSAVTLWPQALLGLVFVWLTLLALRGRRVPPSPVALAFPLSGGTFVVGQGGATAVINYHHPHPSQRYALDILGLGAWGTRARGLYPRDPKRYAIWGAEVVSPCDGVVTAAVDGLPDLWPPERDPTHPPGNHVAIRTENVIVYLAHLQEGSVRVREGDRVRAGQPVGLVGNSGNTTEPHLHVHAELASGAGAPMTFGGRFLARNDRVRAPLSNPEAGEAT
jgi:hypothetical protein